MIRATGQTKTKTKCTKYTVCVLVLNVFTFSSVVQYTHACLLLLCFIDAIFENNYFAKQCSYTF